MAAPLKNANRMRHGLRASKLPSGCQYVEKAIIAFRIAVEDAVLRLRGQIDVLEAALIQSAIRSEQRAMLLERWLRLADSKAGLSVGEQIKLLRERDMASARRDNCLKQLLTPVLADDEPGRRTIDVLRELPPDQLAEFRAKAAVASEQNQLAIQNLREAERIDAIPDANGGYANGGTNAYAGLTVDSVDPVGLDADDGTECQS
jgi:hypothetical protein